MLTLFLAGLIAIPMVIVLVKIFGRTPEEEDQFRRIEAHKERWKWRSR